MEEHSHQLLEQRLNTLLHIRGGRKRDCRCLCVESMLDDLFREAYLKDIFLKLSYGALIELDKIIEKFVQMGYERVERVEAKGTYPRRDY